MASFGRQFLTRDKVLLVLVAGLVFSGVLHLGVFGFSVMWGFMHGSIGRKSLHLKKNKAPQMEMLYFPNEKALEVLSFGYKNVVGHLLWFNIINYFGKHYRSDKTYNYRWFEHMCGVVHRLNPSARYATEFCSTMLSWEMGRPSAAIRLLTSALKREPIYWRYYYLRGFTYLYFLNNDERARQDFLRGSNMPNAPLFLKRIAAKKLAETRLETAYSFLLEMIRTAKSENQRSSLESRLKEVAFLLEIKNLTIALRKYKERFGGFPDSLEELVKRKFYKKRLEDPFGGKFVIQRETGMAVTTSKKGRKILESYLKKHPDWLKYGSAVN